MIDPLTGISLSSPEIFTSDDKLTKTNKLDFREVPILSTFQFIGSGTPADSNVGDFESYTANLFDYKNVLVGKKDINNVFIRRLNNGDIIGNLNETFHLPGGDIFTLGTFDQKKFLEGSQPIKTEILGGTGIYAGIDGKETITNLFTTTPGEVHTSLNFSL